MRFFLAFLATTFISTLSFAAATKATIGLNFNLKTIAPVAQITGELLLKEVDGKKEYYEGAVTANDTPNETQKITLEIKREKKGAVKIRTTFDISRDEYIVFRFKNENGLSSQMKGEAVLVRWSCQFHSNPCGFIPYEVSDAALSLDLRD